MEKIIDAIKKFDKFLIFSHINLEGDSLGSQFAFKTLLEKLGKTGVVANQDKPPAQYDFFGVKNDMVTDLGKDIYYDAVAVLDCPIMERIGKAEKFLKKRKEKDFIINIDHHVSNTNFGTVNWVEPNTSSCGEMIYKLYKALNVPLDFKAALFLYTAILTDTGSFVYENTSSETHAITSELLSKGLNPFSIHSYIYENKSMDEMRLLADSLSTINLVKSGQLAYMFVSKAMLKRHNLGAEAAEGFIKYARSIKGIKVAIIFMEDVYKNGHIQISFRSKDEVDVNKLASLFGGGGHKNASGCVMHGQLNQIIKRVVDTVKNKI